MSRRSLPPGASGKWNADEAGMGQWFAEGGPSLCGDRGRARNWRCVCCRRCCPPGGDLRRFPPAWSVDDPDPKLGQDCYIVRDANGHPVAYVYFEDEPGRQSAAHLMTRDEVTRRIAVNIAKLPELLRSS